MRSSWLVLRLVWGLALMAGCATSGGAGSAASGPLELDGTRWKLTVLEGKLDGRVIEFKKSGPNTYAGRLVERARWMENVPGIPDQMEMFSVRKTDQTNTYAGLYKTYTPGGGYTEQEVNFSVTPEALNWNLASAVWERASK